MSDRDEHGTMKYKRDNLSHVRFSGQAAEPDRPEPLQRGKLTAGVPLPKLIKRRLADAPELVMLGRTRGVAVEKFRRLKTVLLHQEEGAPQVIVVTSAAPSEGKSVVSVNLALSFAADKQGEVLLLDADLRRPTVDGWLSPAPKLGMAELLRGQTELDHALLELENSPLRVLPAGTVPKNPAELLAGDAADALMRALRQRFSRIIIDTPPIVPFTDADVIGRLSDGIVIVARARSTRTSMLDQAINSVTSAPVLGTVLNDVTYSLADRDSYQYTKYYDNYYDRERKK
jgi:capsular exopolysaccharide synthesis family protein